MDGRKLLEPTDYLHNTAPSVAAQPQGKRAGTALNTSVSKLRVVSKQNLQPGRETCKLERESLRKSFAPIAAAPFAFPTQFRAVHCHRAAITHLEFFKRYDFLLSAGRDGRVVVHKDRPMRTFFGHSMGVSGAGLSCDETRLVSASYDGWAKAWDIETGRCTARTNLMAGIEKCAVVGEFAVCGCTDGSIFCVDYKNGEIVYSVQQRLAPVVDMAVGTARFGVVRADGTFEMRILESGEAECILPGSYRRVAATADDEFFVHDGRKVHALAGSEWEDVWETGAIVSNLATCPGKTGIAYGAPRGELVFLPELDRLRLTEHGIGYVCASPRVCGNLAVGLSSGKIIICS